MTLLDGLDRFPWHRVCHAYGAATDVPQLLRALVDPDSAPQKLRDSAARRKNTIFAEVTWTLWGNVFHQGTRWQASSHVVPFLAEILRDGPRDVGLRRFLLVYLHCVGFGYPADAFPALVDPAVEFADAPPPEDPWRLPDAPDEDAAIDERAMCGYARDCYRAVEATLPLIATLARDEDPPTALAAIALLSSFKNSAAATALCSIVEEQSGRRKAIALVGLAQLDPVATYRHAAPLLADTDPFVTIHAAAALVLARPGDVAQSTILALTQLDDLVEEDSPHTETVGALVSRCLERLEPAHTETVVRSLTTMLASTNAQTNQTVTSSLLTLVFEARAPNGGRAHSEPADRPRSDRGVRRVRDRRHGERQLSPAPERLRGALHTGLATCVVVRLAPSDSVR
jgi:hypothetical protein